MEELMGLILSTGTRVIILDEVVLGGVLKRPIVVNYILVNQGIVTETWVYENDPQDRAWGAIKSVDYQLTTQDDVDKSSINTQTRYGKLVVDDLLIALKNQNLTDTQKGSLFTTIHPVVTLCVVGELRAAQALANSISTTTLYNTTRKTWLVDRLQTEIDKI